VDLSVRTRTDNIGLFYTGYLDVPTNGTYTIYLATDGRAFLRLHDASVIDADFGYTNGTEQSASIKLQAGRHPIRLGYIRGTGGTPSLSLQWSGPGISKQVIPSANLLHVDNSTTWAPTANDDSSTAAVDTPVTLDVLANDSIGSGSGPLQIVGMTTPAHGSAITNLDSQIVYTPNSGYIGSDSFDYTITDGLSNATATVSLTVVAAIPPTAGNDAASTSQDTAVAIDVLANDALGSGSGPLRITSVGLPKAGSAGTNQAGQIVYTPNTGFLGEDTFGYTVSDGTGATTGTVTVSVFFYDGMVWFPFNQTSGLTTLDAGCAFTGVLNGFNSSTAHWVAGKWNRAIDFDGAGNYLTISNYAGVLGPSNRTCAAWIKTTSTSSMPVLAWGPHTTGNKWTFLIQNGHVRIEIDSGFLEGATLVNDGDWHHVALTFVNDGTPDIVEAKLYIDGALETAFTTSQSRTINTLPNGDVKIGSDVQSRFFLGRIDEPRIYNRGLSATEIAALYTASNQSAAAWHRRYYGDAPVNWSGPDSLGLPRLLDYAFGGQPWQSDASLFRVKARVAGDRLQVSFNRRMTGSSELIYTPLVTGDLSDWNALAASFLSSTPLSDMPGMEEAVYQTEATISGQINQYIRVRVGFQ